MTKKDFRQETFHSFFYTILISRKSTWYIIQNKQQHSFRDLLIKLKQCICLLYACRPIYAKYLLNIVVHAATSNCLDYNENQISSLSFISKTPANHRQWNSSFLLETIVTLIKKKSLAANETNFKLHFQFKTFSNPF